jgi:hypothetical protein
MNNATNLQIQTAVRLWWRASFVEAARWRGW